MAEAEENEVPPRRWWQVFQNVGCYNKTMCFATQKYFRCYGNPSNAANRGLCNLHVLAQILCRCPQHQSRKGLDTQHVAFIVEWPTPCILAALRNRSPKYLVASTIIYAVWERHRKTLCCSYFCQRQAKMSSSHPIRHLDMIRHGITWPEIPLGPSILINNPLVSFRGLGPSWRSPIFEA